MEEWDGRDALVKRSFNNESLVAKPDSADDIIKRYTDPWRPAYYNRYDDINISRVFHNSCVDGIHGMDNWLIPVMEATKITGGYEQKRLGCIEITCVPDYETGEPDILISIVEPFEE